MARSVASVPRAEGLDVAVGVLAVDAAHALQRGLDAGAHRDLPRGGLDAVVDPVVDTLAPLTVRVRHDDGVAEGARWAGIPAQGRRNVLATTGVGVTGRRRREAAVVRNARNAEGKKERKSGG